MTAPAQSSTAERSAGPRLGATAAPRLHATGAPQLRPYQLTADAAITHELEVKNLRSTLYVAATGTGKTISLCERVRRSKTRGDRTLILAHRDELITQARRKLEAIGITPDVEKGTQRASLNAKVVIASVQSLRGKRLARFARDHFALVIVDECHRVTAATYRAILDHFGEAKILGVTATPDRADGAPLGDIFESVAFRYEIRQAIREAYLVPIAARRVVVDSVDLSGIGSRGGDLAQDELAAVMETERAIRGVVDPLLDLARDRQTVVFGVDVAHATLLADRINELRPGAARMVCGETAEHERERILSDFEAGEFQFLTNVDVLTEGWDCAAVSCIAMVRPTKSRARYVQAAGRGLRLLGATLDDSIRNGKRDCVILDFSGTAGRHKLVGPIDCLAGSEQGMDAFPDDLRAELDRLLGTQQLELESVLARADAEVQARRRALAIDAIVKFHAEAIDPFVGEQRDLPGARWDSSAPIEAQLKALDALGVPLSKLPASFSTSDADRLLGRLRARGSAKPRLCTLKQARRLAQAGIRPTAAITFSRAAELCTKLRIAGWHRPMVLWGEPEAGTPEALAAIAEIRRHMAENRARKATQWHGRGLAPDPEQMSDHEALP